MGAEANKSLKNLRVFLFIVFMVPSIFATANVLDIEINEYSYEHTTYNPLQTGGGQYFDSNENQSSYTLNGTITITNNHPTVAVHDIYINITGISTIYNVSSHTGYNSYISEFNLGSNYMIIYVPDLPAGSSSVLKYEVNSSQIAPPLNITSSYSASKVLAGSTLTITDKVSNELNSGLYSNNCIYNINMVQSSLGLTQLAGQVYNVTFINQSITGSDSGNASITSGNRTLTWSVYGGSCFSSNNITDISYDVLTPDQINSQQDYEIISSVLTYNLNASFSRIQVSLIDAIIDAELEFEKQKNQTLSGDNATWEIYSQLRNPTNVTINVTQVSLWVSVRNGTGTGFTNPSLIDNDTISGVGLTRTYNPNFLLNSTSGIWNNTGSEWYFNYTELASPIVWMTFQSIILNDGTQLTDRSISYGQNNIYVKELYISTTYWLEIIKNITRTGDGTFNVFIQVMNKGPAPTPANQVVQVYNFIPNTFNLTSGMLFSTSPWYTTDSTNETLNDPIYNGTMFQFGIIQNSNPRNSSLDVYGGASNENNTWTVTYNVTGDGEFNFEDLFLTGVDPLNVEEYGATKALSVQGVYNFVSSKVEVFLSSLAALALLLIVFI